MQRREFLGAAAAAAVMLGARPALAEPMAVKWVTQFDSMFKGHQRVVIPAYHINFIVWQQATAAASIAARSRLVLLLTGIDVPTLRKLTDEAYADLKAQFVAAGIGVASEADAQAMVATAGMERLPGNMITVGGGKSITIGKSVRRGFVTLGATDAPALTAYRLPESQTGLGAIAAAGQINAGAKMVKPAWDLDATIVVPSLTLDFAEMQADNGGMFGGYANSSGQVKFRIDMDSPVHTLNPTLNGRSANPGGLRPNKDVVSQTPFATVEKGGAQVRSMGTWVDENYQSVARARGDAVVVDLPVWEGLVRDAYRGYNAAIVAAVVKAVKK
ncbi:MAG: hypothetical protein KA105_09650 [Caulobacter sp.]|jgi:hypothetical protein|nr:hypothetical protein [Caulobacter sp.]